MINIDIVSKKGELMFTHEPLLVSYRNQTLDTIHMGHLCVVDENSNVLFSVGDPDAFVFYRSCSKPIQALPVIVRRLDEKYSLTEEETTIFSASHLAEPFHVRAVESILAKAGFSESIMIMDPTYPGAFDAELEVRKAGLPPRKIYHNCSGKHSGALLLQRELGGKPEDYWKPNSVAQTEIKRVVAILSETEPDQIQVGVDGCGVPVFAVEMRKIAASFKNLVAPNKIPEADLREAAERYIPRIHRYPQMIRGTGTLCALLNADPNILSKAGAAGVYTIGLKKEKIGIALKMTDGFSTVWPLIIHSLFEQIGYTNKDTLQGLRALMSDQLLNDNKEIVGHYEPCFTVPHKLIA
jgi:L-asparaginase II